MVVLTVGLCVGCQDSAPVPGPTTEPPTTEPPTTEPPTTEPPLPAGYGHGVTSLTFYGIGDAGVGDTGEQVAATLGVDLTTVLEETDTCMAVLDRTESIGVVIDEGTVQAFLVRIEGLGLEQVAAAPVEVGDHFDALYDAYPDEFLYAGPSEQYRSVFHGPRATISPTELAGTLPSMGRSVHYAGDLDGIIREIRVGSTSYVDQLSYCPGACAAGGLPGSPRASVLRRGRPEEDRGGQ